MAANPDSAPDILIVNADVRTMATRGLRKSAISISGKRILAVGEAADLLKTAGPETHVIDAEGRTVLPGFTDAHIHFFRWAQLHQGLNLEGSSSLEDLLLRLKTEAPHKDTGDWIVGHGWNETAWPDARHPLRSDLDAVCPDRPVMLWRSDFHLAAANSPALLRAGITENTPDPPYGVIDRDAAGKPTGILRDDAITALIKALPETTAGAATRAIIRAARQLHRFGVTCIHDFRLLDGRDGFFAVNTVKRACEEGSLPLRVWETLHSSMLEQAISEGLRTGAGQGRFFYGHVKFFADGSMGARTAKLFEPYLDGGEGIWVCDREEMARKIEQAHNAGIASAVHAIGDRAVSEIIDLYARLSATPPPSGATPPAFAHRMEHAQMIREADVPRLRACGAAASVQPLHVLDDMDMVDRCLGERGGRVYAFAEMAAAGVPLVFGSDCPVARPEPLLGIHAAVNRSRPGEGAASPWHPQNLLPLDAAVEAYTANPARLTGHAFENGFLLPGRRADVVMLDRSLWDTPDSDLHACSVDMTVFDGDIVYNQLDSQ